MTKTLRLTALTGRERGKVWEIRADDMTIGRSSSNPIQLRDDLVSRVHARVDRGGDGILLTDLSSSNGSFVDGEAAGEQHPATIGSLITLGNTILLLEEAGGSKSMALTLADTVQGPSAELSGVVGLDRSGQDSQAESVWRHVAQAMLDIASAMARSPVWGDLLNAIAASARSAIDADRAALALLDDETGQLRIAASSSNDRAADKSVTMSVTLSRRVIDTGGPLLWNSRDAAEDADQRITAYPGAASSIICAPIVAEGRVLGVLHFDRGRKGLPFVQRDLKSAALLGNMVGLAVPFWQDRRKEADKLTTLEVVQHLGHPIISDSEVMKGVLSVVERAARTNVVVLLQGESGTGKEMMARLIHHRSPRSAAPLITVNCATVEPHMAESELFGHEKGAFTGAVERRIGKFEQADGATLFLDEVGELSIGCQAKLLRVLEQKEFERLGGSEPITVDVRLIAATNRDLRKEVRGSRFRSDLLHRLAVLPILLPPLREHRDDIGPMVDHYLDHFVRVHRAPPLRLTGEARSILLEYDWPGNARQLRNILERLVILSNKGEVAADHIREALAFYEGSADAQDLVESRPGADLSLEQAREQFEREFVTRVLKTCRWNRTRAAETLGIARPNLVQKLKKLGIVPPDRESESS